jgi:hypothetical protein
MPVTIHASPDKVGRIVDESYDHPKVFLYCAYGPTKKKVFHSSFPSNTAPEKVIPLKNDFVNGVICAYRKDLHLVLRPDDIWLSIITQFSFYVSGHA